MRRVGRLLLGALLGGLPALALAQAPLRVAAPGFTGVGMDDAAATRISDRFAAALVQAGLDVRTSSEVARLVGEERQRQLQGCSEETAACVAAIVSALDVDALLIGAAAKLGGTYQANVKLIHARSGEQYTLLSKRGGSEEELIRLLEIAAPDVADSAYQVSGRPRPRSAATVIRPRGLASWVISFAPAALAFNSYGGELEYALTNEVSVYVSPYYLKPNELVLWRMGESMRERGLGIGARLYVSRMAPEGFFVGARAVIAQWTTPKQVVNQIAAEGELGYALILWRHLALSAGLNAGMAFVPQGYGTEDVWNPRLGFRFNAGVAF